MSLPSQQGLTTAGATSRVLRDRTLIHCRLEVQRTALQAAFYFENHRLVEFLLENGADLNTQGGGYGNDVESSFHKEIESLSAKKGAVANAQGSD